MKRLFCLALAYLCVLATVRAQSPPAAAPAVNPVQVSPDNTPAATGEDQRRQVKIPAGTPVEIEVAYSVSSIDVRANDLISFRIVVPITADGVTVIDKDALVTARVVQAKRGGHWGKAGKLSWIMQDVVAVDLTRVPLTAHPELPGGQQRLTGTSHGGQVAAQIAIAAPLMLFAAPIALMAGFKRGENAVLPEGKRFIVFISADTLVQVK